MLNVLSMYETRRMKHSPRLISISCASVCNILVPLTPSCTIALIQSFMSVIVFGR